MPFAEQKTLSAAADLSGYGVHSGARSHVRINPAEADSGIVFAPKGRRKPLGADWRHVAKTELCTTIADGQGFSVATIEHLMAALSGLGVDNASIEVDGPEVPILDGSAAAFVEAIDDVGLSGCGRARKYLRVLKSVRVERGAAFSMLSPSEGGFALDVAIDFASGPIGRQRRRFTLTPGAFRNQIARARTFGDVADLKKLLALGFARGSSMANTIALDGGQILNPEGLRFPDEFVRHKALDAVGDLALAGAPLQAEFEASRPGHGMNYAVLAALFADPDAYEWVEADFVPAHALGAREPAMATV